MSLAAGGAPPDRVGTTPRRGGLAVLAGGVLAALVIATFLAIFYAQELKRRPPLLKHPTGSAVIAFRPVGPITGTAVHHYAHLRVEATVGGEVRISFVSVRSGRVVFAIEVRVRRYRSVFPVWKGTTSGGADAPPGDYRLRIHVSRVDQTVVPLLRLRLIGPPR